MNSGRIKEIQLTTAYPESVSVKQALLQVWNECEQEKVKNCSTPAVSGSLLQSLHQDLKGFQDMGFLSPDAKSGLGIAIEQVERYMRSDLEARQQ
jgi:hypothetical protein